jgi:hypothetical protein
MDAHDYERIGVYDPGAPDAEARLEMLQHLTGAGVTPAQLARAEQNGDLLAALPEVRLHGPGERVSVAEVVARTALDPAFVVRVRLAAGLGGFGPMDVPATEADAAGEAAFTEADVAAFGELAQIADLVGDDAAEAFIATLGAAAATAANQSVTDLVTRIEEPLSNEVLDDALQAEALDTTLAVLATVPRLFDVLFRHHAYVALTQFLRDHPARQAKP